MPPETDTAMERLAPLLCELFRVDQAQLSDRITMNDLDGWDSLTHMELITSLESTFSIELSGDEIADMQSIGAIRKTLQNHGLS